MVSHPMGDTMETKSCKRDLRFLDMTFGQPMIARCNGCNKVFATETKGGEGSVAAAIWIRVEFDQHTCSAGSQNPHLTEPQTRSVVGEGDNSEEIRSS